MRRIYRLIVKEVKELVRDKYVLFSIILAPLIVMPLTLGITYIALRGVGETLREAFRGLPENIVVVLEDVSDELANIVAQKLGVRTEYNVDEALRKYTIVVILHSGFTENMLNGKPAMVTVISKVEKPYNIFEQTARLTIVGTLNDVVRDVLAERANLNPKLIKSPVIVESRILYKGGFIDEFRVMLVYAISIGVEFIILILGLLSLQVGAISIGVEREARTLELLLTLPISRLELVLGKVLGISLISLMGFTSFLVGFSLSILMIPLAFTPMIPSVFSDVTKGFMNVTETPQITMPILPLGLINLVEELKTLTLKVAVVLISIALAMFASTIFGILVGILFVGDVRGALTSTSYIALILATPLIADIIGAMGASLPTLLQVTFLLSPMYPPFKIAQSVIAGETGLAIAYAIATLINITLLLLLTVILVKSERLIYGIRLRRVRRSED